MSSRPESTANSEDEAENSVERRKRRLSEQELEKKPLAPPQPVLSAKEAERLKKEAEKKEKQEKERLAKEQKEREKREKKERERER